MKPARIGLGTSWALLACTLAASAAPAYATPSIMSNDIPNGATAFPTAGKCALCHAMPSPGMCMPLPCLNTTFGTNFMAGGPGWTAALAMADFDSDGFTNGQELQDPAGTWTKGSPQPGIAAHVTAPYSTAEHPGLHDADMDHMCWFGRDMDNDFQCTGAAERAVTDRDCDDTNPLRYSGASELCDGADQDCDGRADEGLADCDPGAGNCGAGLGENMAGDCHPRERIDGDRDGYCLAGTDLSDPRDWDCVDAGEQTALSDCDDFDAKNTPGATELCLDGQDNSCDQLVDGADADCTDYADADQDGFCPTGQDLDADRRCDEGDEPLGPRDCDDGDAAIAPGADEVCLNGEDDDCDGLLDGRDEGCADYRDLDFDGYCAAGRDRNDDGLCDARGEPSASDADCDETRPNVHAGAPENCIDERDNDCDGESDETGACVADRDEDGDGFCPLGRDLSRPLDGDCRDPNEVQSVSDCDDEDGDVNPDSVEDCADIFDNDCDGFVDLADDDCDRLLDADGDSYCPEGLDLSGDGDCLDFDEARPIRDCDDTDENIRPRIGERCDDGIDNDCNGDIDGFDRACACEDDDMCPVEAPCMLGRCQVGAGCYVLPDPECTADAGAGPDGGAAADGGGVTGEADGGLDAGALPDAGGGRPEDEEPPPELEDVGCGCVVAGAPAVSDAPWLALGLAPVLGLLLRSRRRARARAATPRAHC